MFTRVFIALLLASFSPIFSQFISNPSFEGTPGQSVSPTGWSTCDVYSTPDVQPGFWNVFYPASEGKTYISLIARGVNGGIRANTSEDIQTELIKPLIKDSNYVLKIDLAYSDKYAIEDDSIKPLKIKIWGGTGSCLRTELLAESNKINHSNWISYSFPINPKNNNYTYLIIEAYWTTTNTYYGNILIDNIQLSKPIYLGYPIIRDVNCPGNQEGEILFSVSGGISPITFNWSNGSKSQNLLNVESGTYSVTIQDATGYSIDTSFIVLEKNSNPDFRGIMKKPICYNQNNGEITLLSNKTENIDYTFNWSNGSTDSILSLVGKGNYEVTISNNYCSKTLSFNLEEPKNINITETIEKPRCNKTFDGKISLSVTGGTTPYTYMWSDYSNNNLLTEITTGTYTVTVIDANNCPSVSKTIELKEFQSVCLEIPTAFSPNGDGINDTWDIPELRNYLGQNVKIYIFDRSGNTVYAASKYTAPWDGYYNNSPLPLDTYYYIIELPDSNKPIMGDITILR